MNSKAAAANLETPIHKQRTAQTPEDLVLKAYAAGSITAKSSLIVFGTGAERGTWHDFTNIHVEGMPFMQAIEHLTWFTTIYSTAMRNQGSTPRKTNYWLSQMQEITPLAESFGFLDRLHSMLADVRMHDAAAGLVEEEKETGCIANWEDRTAKLTLDLSSIETEIMDAVMQSLLVSPVASGLDRDRLEELLASAFIEGTRGLSCGTEDIAALMQGESIIARYNRRAA